MKIAKYTRSISKSGEGNKNNTGIGLSIVHKIVLGLGGTIDLESEVKKGTTFIIILPHIIDIINYRLEK